MRKRTEYFKYYMRAYRAKKRHWRKIHRAMNIIMLCEWYPNYEVYQDRYAKNLDNIHYMCNWVKCNGAKTVRIWKCPLTGDIDYELIYDVA